MVTSVQAQGQAGGGRLNLPFIIGASSVGTLIEWYDFYLYGVLAVFFAQHFFPPGNQNLAFIASLGVFWTGFVVRPFGAIVFGHLGDLIGRKFTFMLTLLLMGAATFVVGLLPGYASIGTAAPVLLVLMRVIQGLALGGEYGGAATYIAEHAPDGRRGFYTSWIQTTATLGLFLSLLVAIESGAGWGTLALLATLVVLLGTHLAEVHWGRFVLAFALIDLVDLHLDGVRDLVVRYDRVVALDGVTFTLGRGTALGIVGPNGSGKSTLLKAVAGLVEPTGGSVRIDGKRPRDLSPGTIGYVPQIEDVDWSFPVSVRDVVTMGRYPRVGAFRRFSAHDHRAVARAIEALDLGAIADRHISELSGGQQQRAFVARAIAQEPLLLLLGYSKLALASRLSRPGVGAVIAKGGPCACCRSTITVTVPWKG